MILFFNLRDLHMTENQEQEFPNYSRNYFPSFWMLVTDRYVVPEIKPSWFIVRNLYLDYTNRMPWEK